MIQLILFGVLLLIVLYGLRAVLLASSSTISKPLIWLGLLVLFAAATRLGWIVPAIGAVTVIVLRLLPALVTLSPLWRRLLHGAYRDKAEDSTGPRPVSGRMSRQEAYEILGLDPGASREEICAAHRRLIQKMHPDRGGSDYLAGKINQARDTLLSP